MTKFSLTVKDDDITSSRRDMDLGTVGGSGAKGVKDILEVHCSTYNAVDISECNNIILSNIMCILNFL